MSSVLDFGRWIRDFETPRAVQGCHRNQPIKPTKTMGDKSPKANQKKSAQKQAKAVNTAQAKKQASAAKQAGVKK
jgi:hypothetical protein